MQKRNIEMNPSTQTTLEPESQTNLLCYLVATVAASYSLTNEWRVDRVVESCRIWLARNRVALPWLKRVTLGQLALQIARRDLCAAGIGRATYKACSQTKWASSLLARECGVSPQSAKRLCVSVLPPDLAGEQTSKSTAEYRPQIAIMENQISPDAVVSGDRNLVVFDAHIRERSVQCSIAREALELYFWAPAGASDAQLLKSYVDGRRRIEAIVSRKLLATPGEAVGLSMSDFAR